ncbi:MAG: DUF6702 family protein [Planctomycetota bacterium]
MMAALLAGLLLHPAHECLAELDWHADGGLVRVSLRLSRSDASWLRRDVSQADDRLTAESAKAAVATIRKHLHLETDIENSNPSGASSENRIAVPPTIHFVGEEEDGFHVWWHFEYRLPDGARPERVRSSLLRHHLSETASRSDGHDHAVVQMRFTCLSPDGYASAKSVVLTDCQTTQTLPW